MKKFWSFFSSKKSKPKPKPEKEVNDKPLEAMQIGISSTCNLNCTFCPTSFIQENNKKQMPLDLFKKLIPFFGWTKWVYLQGWGEPLLNKDIWEMTNLIKKADTKVGFTTNGTLLNNDVIEKIIEYQVDLVSVSIAGDSPEVHNKLRKGSDFGNIIENVEKLIKIKKQHNALLPKVSLSYMLTKETIEHLPDMVDLACKINVDDLYATNLDYVFNEHANDNKIFSWDAEPNKHYLKIISKAKDIANKSEFSFRHYDISFKEQHPVCELDPSRFVFITNDGNVTPCTYLGRKINPRIYKDQKFDVPLKSFGNINEQTFEEIWNSKDYTEFRRIFSERNRIYNQILEELAEAEPSLIILEESERKFAKLFKEYPLPEACQGCTKIFGV
jgi:MoaA/NifB/PqqE/SkfB family radical SAM enzyme